MKMKRLIHLLLSALIVVPLLLAVVELQAREYQMSGLEVEIVLDEDGRVYVREDREFTFKGRFSEVYRTFPLDGKASFDDFRVFEGEMEYVFTGTGEPGTARLVRKDNYKELQLFFDAADTTRVFTIEHTVTGAVDKFEDAALLYYQIVSDEWTKPIHNIRAVVIPPDHLPDGEPPHWVHGSLDAVSAVVDDGVVTIALERLPAKRYLEIRALYPRELFGSLPGRDGLIREQVMEEVARLTREANRMREEALAREARRETLHGIGRQTAIPVALVIVMLWFWLFRKYGERPYQKKRLAAASTLPEKDPPALVNYLLNRANVTGSALVSTLFHLAYRKFLTLEEQPPNALQKIGRLRKPNVRFVLDRPYLEANAGTLLPYEKELLYFLFNTMADNQDELSLRRMKKRSRQMQQFYPRWRKMVKSEAVKKEWFDKESKKGMTIGVASSVVLMILLGVAVAFFGPWMLIPMAVSFFLLFGSMMIMHRTAEGEKTYQQWKSLRKHLKRSHFDSGMKELNEERVNEYLIYGLALGLGRRYFKRLTGGLERSGYTGYLYWILLQQSSMDRIGKTINEVISTTSSTMSSSSGAGGGGTMGGGGGASSGGGGAR